LSQYFIIGDGQVFSWGDTTDGVLGVGSVMGFLATPRIIDSFRTNTVKKLSLGNKFAVALTGWYFSILPGRSVWVVR
jgi:alpha-tubulin suppressor-like RCC1 family protein